MGKNILYIRLLFLFVVFPNQFRSSVGDPTELLKDVNAREAPHADLKNQPALDFDVLNQERSPQLVISRDQELHIDSGEQERPPQQLIGNEQDIDNGTNTEDDPPIQQHYLQSNDSDPSSPQDVPKRTSQTGMDRLLSLHRGQRSTVAETTETDDEKDDDLDKDRDSSPPQAAAGLPVRTQSLPNISSADQILESGALKKSASREIGEYFKEKHLEDKPRTLANNPTVHDKRHQSIIGPPQPQQVNSVPGHQGPATPPPELFQDTRVFEQNTEGRNQTRQHRSDGNDSDDSTPQVAETTETDDEKDDDLDKDRDSSPPQNTEDDPPIQQHYLQSNDSDPSSPQDVPKRTSQTGMDRLLSLHRGQRSTVAETTETDDEKDDDLDKDRDSSPPQNTEDDPPIQQHYLQSNDSDPSSPQDVPKRTSQTGMDRLLSLHRGQRSTVAETTETDDEKDDDLDKDRDSSPPQAAAGLPVRAQSLPNISSANQNLESGALKKSMSHEIPLDFKEKHLEDKPRTLANNPTVHDRRHQSIIRRRHTIQATVGLPVRTQSLPNISSADQNLESGALKKSMSREIPVDFKEKHLEDKPRTLANNPTVHDRRHQSIIGPPQPQQVNSVPGHQGPATPPPAFIQAASMFEQIRQQPQQVHSGHQGPPTPHPALFQAASMFEQNTEGRNRTRQHRSDGNDSDDSTPQDVIRPVFPPHMFFPSLSGEDSQNTEDGIRTQQDRSDRNDSSVSTPQDFSLEDIGYFFAYRGEDSELFPEDKEDEEYEEGEAAFPLEEEDPSPQETTEDLGLTEGLSPTPQYHLPGYKP